VYESSGNIEIFKQVTLTDGEGSLRLTSSLRKLVSLKKEIMVCVTWKALDPN